MRIFAINVVLVIFIANKTVVAKLFEKCTKESAEQVINQLHDDLDDDEDGSISNTENRAFISEYGGPASSIGALLDDNDGRVSKNEFLNAWKSSAVHNWTAEDVVNWLKSPDLNFPTELTDKLEKIFIAHNIDGTCFPLLARLEQTFLKDLGIKQHLVRRKIALRSMDAILFGPPVYDNTIKDFILAIMVVFVLFSLTFIFRLKRQFRDVQARLSAESSRLHDLDHMWKEFNDGPNNDHDSGTTILDLPAELSQLTTYKRENEQLRRSLEEAHKELRTMQDGGSVDHIQISSELKSLLYKTYRIEKEQLDVRRQEAKKYEKLAGENLLKMQRANDSLFSSIRLIHSPKQLDQVDSTILHAQTAIDELVVWQRESRDRWRKLETIFRINIVNRGRTVGDGQPSPPDRQPRNARVGKLNLRSKATSGTRDLKEFLQRKSFHGSHLFNLKGILQHQHSIEHSIHDSTISEDSCPLKSNTSIERHSPKHEINGNGPSASSNENQKGDSLNPLLSTTSGYGTNSGPGSSSSHFIPPSDRSFESGSVTSSQSHIKVKKNRFKLFDRKRLPNLSFRKSKSSSKHKLSE